MATDSTISGSTIDVRQSIEDARHAAASAGPEDGSYGELMATYVELGELYESGRTDHEYEQECRALVDRLVVLGVVHERYLGSTVGRVGRPEHHVGR